MLRPFVIVFVFFACFGSGHCGECSASEQVKSAEAVLREKLFCNYNKKVRPVKHSANQTLVQIELYPLAIAIDEYQESITLHGNMQIMWMDYYLEWDPTEYDNITALSMLSEDIWMPHLTISAPADINKIQTNTADCIVFYNGRVLCMPTNTISARCPPNLRRYPFDRQNCTILFLAPAHQGATLNLNVIDVGVKMKIYRPNKAWELISISMKRQTVLTGSDENSTFYPYLRCNVILQRHYGGLVAVIILPGLVLAGLTLLTFFMEDLFSTRVAVSALTSLCNVLYCLHLGQNIPSNGDEVPLLVTYFRDSMIMSSFALVTAVLVHRLQKISHPASNWLASLMSKLEMSPVSKIFFSREPFRGDDDTAEMIEDAKKKPAVWSQLANVIDKLVFFVFLFVYLILFFFYLP